MLRKNRYGSGSAWAGERATLLFGVVPTLGLWDSNPRVGLGAYLRACAAGGGGAPPTWEGFVPWKMSEQKRQEWSVAKKEAEDRS